MTFWLPTGKVTAQATLANAGEKKGHHRPDPSDPWQEGQQDRWESDNGKNSESGLVLTEACHSCVHLQFLPTKGLLWQGEDSSKV